jgi:dihydroxyacetone kinase
VSSQQGAAATIIESAALADAVRSGKVRWVLADGGGGGGGPGADGRVGSTTVMAAVQQACPAVSGVDSLYDCAGRADALEAAA